MHTESKLNCTHTRYFTHRYSYLSSSGSPFLYDNSQPNYDEQMEEGMYGLRCKIKAQYYVLP